MRSWSPCLFFLVVVVPIPIGVQEIVSSSKQASENIWLIFLLQAARQIRIKAEQLDYEMELVESRGRGSRGAI